MFFCVAIWWAYFDDFFQKNSIISMKKEKVTCKSHCTPKKGVHISTSTHQVAGKIQLSLKCRNVFLLTSVNFLMYMRHIKPLAWLRIVFQLLFWFSVLLWKIFPILAEFCLTSCLLLRLYFGIILKVLPLKNWLTSAAGI